jgi:CRP/FNR family transcriptional regulator, cyclic AMP receptor protein
MGVYLSVEATMLPLPFNLAPLLSTIGHNKKPVFFRKKQIIFSLGDRSDSLFYIETGTVKLTITSADGKEAFIGLLDGGDFFGESCLASDKPRFYTAKAFTDVQVLKMDRAAMIRILRTNSEFAYGFTTHLIRRTAQAQEDLASSLLDSSEKRLAQVLLSLNQLAQSGESELAAQLNQQDLADIVGITRQRANVLIQRLKKVSAGPFGRLRRNP